MTASTSPLRRALVVAALATVPLGLAAGQAAAGSPAAPAPSVAPVVALGPVSTALVAATGGQDDPAPAQHRQTAAERAHAATATAGGPVALPTTTPTCAVGGIVWDDSSQDGLKTAGETGVTGSEVVLRWNGSTVLRSVTTGTDGRYLFDGLQCGSYDVGFTLPSGYSWTAPDQGSGTNDSHATDPGPSFVDGITPVFTVAPGQGHTRPATTADGVSAGYVDADVDAGMFVTGSAAVRVPTAAPAAGAPVPAAPAPVANPATGSLAYTGTAAENTGWTGAALLAAGVTLVVGTTRRPRRVRVTA